LAQTLSSPEKTRELVQSIVATDENTGQTYDPQTELAGFIPKLTEMVEEPSV
jgi:hypothetical protein